MSRISAFLFYQTLLTSLINQANSAKICIFSVVTNPLSYRPGYEVLLEALLDQGHEITLFSNFPMDDGQRRTNSTSKVKHIFANSAKEHMQNFHEFISPLEWRAKGKANVMWDMHPILSLDVCNLILESPELADWIKSTGHYDLFIVDSLWNECGIGLSYLFKAKLMLFSFHSNLQSWNLDAFGSPLETYSFPDMQNDVSVSLTYFQRLRSTFRAIRWEIYRNAFIFYQTRKLILKHLHLTAFPSIGELEQTTKLFLVNSHSTEVGARSLPPMFVSVGGIHISEEKIENVAWETTNKFLKQSVTSKEFILVNIGCSPESDRKLPKHTLQHIFNAFGAMKDLTTFVFACKKSLIKKYEIIVSKNVLILEICSSATTSLLGHPKARGLITHGDLLDIQEAMHHGVPVIAFPVGYDQDGNVERLVSSQRGIRLEISEISESQLVRSIEELLNNKIYKVNMEKASRTFRHRQVKPLDSALWWIDNILKNSDTDGLKPLALNQSWYIRRSLDIWCPIFCGVGICLSIVFVLAVISFKKFALPYFTNTKASINVKEMTNSHLSNEDKKVNKRRSARINNIKKN